MRDKVTTALELIGAASITAGVGFGFGFQTALIVGGVFLIGIGYLEGRNP